MEVDKVVASALEALSDLANCVSGEFHTMHLNFVGEDFDTMHKKTLKKYYEEAADDYDSFAESTRMFGNFIPSTNESAKRIAFKSLGSKPIKRAEAIDRTDLVLQTYLEQMTTVWAALNKSEKCPLKIGIANLLQTRLEYWSKEYAYFNKSRREGENK